MRHLLFIILLMSSYFVVAQTRTELEERRKKTLEEIEYVNSMLQETARQKAQGTGELKIISSRIGLRENVITGLKSEIDLLNTRIDLNRLSVSMMDADLVRLRNEYAANIRSAWNVRKDYHPSIFILSAKDFNQGYKRMKYIQQAARFRRRQSEIIADLVVQISSTRARLENDLARLNELRSREESQKRQLETDYQRQQRLIRELSGREKQLQQDLENKRRVANQVQAEINRMIEAERKKAATSELTPEQVLIGNDFVSNRGRLPWPVERGIITSKFGEQQHPVMKHVKLDNPGIEITCSGTTQVRAVFKGEVKSVIGITGANMAVIIRHGKYLTVYQNLVNVKVKPGDMVDTKAHIGNVYIETDGSNRGILNFYVYEETKRLNPEAWLAGKN